MPTDVPERIALLHDGGGRGDGRGDDHDDALLLHQALGCVQLEKKDEGKKR